MAASKFLNIPNGNYKLKVQDGGNVTFDTGSEGTVFITGNLEIQGSTTTVNSTELTVTDNMILLNDGYEDSGIPQSVDYISGLEINRGSQPNALFVWDDETTIFDPDSSTNPQGGWVLYRGQKADNKLAGIFTNSIKSENTDIAFQTGASSALIIKTPNYEDNVVDDDHIPNRKYVNDYVATYAIANPPSQTVSGDTRFKASDVDVVPNLAESILEFFVNEDDLIDPVSSLTETTGRFYDISIVGNTISTVTSGNDLNLQGSDGGVVKIADTLQIDTNPDGAPGIPTSGTVVYHDTAYTDTGLLFKTSAGKQGEVSSKKTAILYSLIF